MTSTCNFYMNKPHGMYQSGETVDGNVVLNLASAKSVDGVYIALCGEGTVFWKKHGDTLQKKRNRRASLKVTEYKSDEIYDGPRQHLMDGGFLQPGQYSFKFSLALPIKCPSSFEGSLGLIRYYLLVAICSSTCLNIEFKYPLNIVKIDDLNINRANKLPLKAECIKTYSSYSCLEGRLHISFISPFGAYVPRQKLPYSLSIDNHSKKEVYAYGITIEQRILYISRLPRKDKHLESNEVYSKKFVERCSRSSSREIRGEVEIPDVTPTSEGNNRIINIEYVLIVSAYISGCIKTLNMSIPIHIGTIPIRESLQDYNVKNTTPSAPMLPQLLGDGVEKPMLSSMSNSLGERCQNYQNLKSPVFEESSGIMYPRTYDGFMVCAAENVLYSCPEL